ncbi:MAG: hypothetical protein ACRC6K_04300 [Fusobacteriaceae bacterium]
MSIKKLNQVIFTFLCVFNVAVSTVNIEEKPPLLSLPTESENVDEVGNRRHLLKNYTLMIEAKVNIFVPLEIVSDIEINADVFGEQIVNIPFAVELNREPEKENYYKLKYSETEIDIDEDGSFDVFIYSPEFINTRYVRDNYVQVQGDKISRDGSYQKAVYITVEAGI